jgi:hypothetical protein
MEDGDNKKDNLVGIIPSNDWCLAAKMLASQVA